MISKEAIGQYTEAQWQEEMRAKSVVFQRSDGSLFSLGTILPCPHCKTIGFYGPRVSPSTEKPTRKYRACKFCGLWQEAWGDGYNTRGGDVYRCIHLTCTNKKCRASNWTASNEGKSCDACHGPTIVSKWASDDPSHSFRQLEKIVIRSLS